MAKAKKSAKGGSASGGKFKKAKKPVRKVVAKKTKKPAPLKREAEVKKSQAAFDWDKAIDDLVKRAVARGFITEAEVTHALPELEDNISAVEKFLDALDS